MRPLVTIGMPVFNDAATVAATIRSLLNQTMSDWELIIIDDGSTDDTATVAGRFRDRRITMVNEARNRGLATRLNQTIAFARGRYYARLDGDDISYPDRLEKQVGFLESHPDVDLVGSRIVVFDAHGEPRGTTSVAADHEQICRRPWSAFSSLLHPAWCGRSRWFAKHPYDGKMPKAQDRELLLRAYRTSRFACLPEPLVGYRQEDLSWKKLLTTRFYLCQALWNQAIRGGDPVLLRGLPLQAAKASIDMFAIATGLKYRLLRHRALPLSAKEQDRWREIWNSCQLSHAESRAA